MVTNKELLIKRIDELIELAKSRDDFRGEGEVTSGTIAILEAIYGAESQKCKAYVAQYQSYAKITSRGHNELCQIILSTEGVLQSIKAEVEAGLVGNITSQAQAGIFADFISAARQALEEDNNNVAAVLACASLEDALKRYAEQHGLNVTDKDMSEVINALKSNSLLKDPQASIVQGHVKLRNKAFHAEWDKIEKEGVSSAIGFTEQFILSNFG